MNHDRPSVGRGESMDLTKIKSLIPEHAKDLRLNLSTVLSAEGAPGLAEHQILGVALASAIAARDPALLREIEALVGPRLDAAQVAAARAAASIMGMNNVYYRFVHLAENPDYAKLPAKLRMNVIGNPGVPKTDFELYSLAVSAINGCGACVAAHDRVVRDAGVAAEGVQSAVRIAAVLHGVAVALESTAGASAIRDAA
jgi:alkyl hydroperoxide reductase subunit D